MTTCPWCGRTNEFEDSIHNRNKHTFKDGDVSMCMGCGKLGLFDASHKGGMRKPTVEEARQILRDPDVFKMLMAWEFVNGRTGMT